MTKKFNMFVPIQKVDEERRLVYGIATAEKMDKSGEVFDYASSKSYYQSWSDEIHKASQGKSFGNIREMHGKSAAGILAEPLFFNDDQKQIEIVAKVVDDQAWQKVLTGVYTGFSHGGGYVKRWKENGVQKYTAEISEISLVDNPCLSQATFEVIKANGQIELMKFKGADDMTKIADTTEAETAVDSPETVEKSAPVAELKQVWLAKDGSHHEKKAHALKKNMELEALEKIAPAIEAMESVEKAMEAGHNIPEGKTTEQETGHNHTDTGHAPETTPSKEEMDAKGKSDKAKHEAVTTTEAGHQKADGLSEVDEALNKVAELAATGNPATEETPVVELAKSMCDVAQCASLIEQLNWFMNSLDFDAAYSGKETTTPEQLKSIIGTLCAFLTVLVAENNAELTGTAAEKFQKAAFAAMMKYVSGLPSASDDLEKVTVERDLFQKTLTDFMPRLNELEKKISLFESQPQNPKGFVRAVEKGQELSGVGDTSPAEAFAAHMAKLTPEEANKELMKMTLRMPIQL